MRHVERILAALRARGMGIHSAATFVRPGFRFAPNRRAGTRNQTRATGRIVVFIEFGVPRRMGSGGVLP